jgi:hypothetical protein
MNDIRHYTTFTPGDGGILDRLEDRYGSNFEAINKREKMSLIRGLSIQLCMEFSDDTYSIQLNGLVQRMNCLPIGNRIGLIRCLIENIEFPATNKGVNNGN